MSTVPREALEGLSAQAGDDSDFSEVAERLEGLQGTVTALQHQLDEVSASGSYDRLRVSAVAMNLTPFIPVSDGVIEEIDGEHPVNIERDQLDVGGYIGLADQAN